MSDPVFAEIVSQGDEVLSGAVLDSNAAEISAALLGAGLVVARRVTVGDDLDAIATVLREAAGRAREVVCTGGLGPTEDDLTAEAVSVAFGVPLERRQEALDQLAAWGRRWNRPVNEASLRQARLPVGADLLENHWGTAPGFRVTVGPCRLWFFPGVPREMRGMVRAYLVPDLRERYRLPAEVLVTLRTLGYGESVVQEKLAGLAWPGIRVGYRALLPETQVKLYLAPAVPSAVRDEAVAAVRERLGSSVFGLDSGPIEEVVGALLGSRGETVATAESCTGGRLAAAFTRVPGSSAWFLEGAVTYSNGAKVRCLGVDPATLDRHGAVSEAVARQMAEGIRRAAGATWGIGTTGVAGPGGGSAEKPVGTVHLAVAGPGGTTHRVLQGPGEREVVMERAVGSALDLLRRCIQGAGG